MRINIVMRLAEYEQQLKHLKLSVDEIIDILNSKNLQYALIIHDKDAQVTTGGEEVAKEPHLHVMMNFNGISQTPETISKWFNDEPNRIEKAKTRGKYAWNNMLSYLCHEADKTGKYKYNAEDVIANFDYVEKLKDISKQVKSKNEKDDLLIKIMNNEIPRIKLDEYIDDITRHKWNKDIELAYKIRDQKLSKENSRNMSVIYITGKSGTGKSKLAEIIAERKNLTVYAAGSSNDPLEGYMGQECIIYDDIRGSDWKMSDFLKFLDHHRWTMTKSRYNNKVLSDLKLIILTSVQEIENMYLGIKEHENEPIVQLKRRCSTLIEVDKEYCKEYKYKEALQDYDWTEMKVFKNPVPEWVEKYGEKSIFDDNDIEDIFKDVYEDLGMNVEIEYIKRDNDEDEYIKEQEEYIKEAQENIEDYKIMKRQGIIKEKENNNNELPFDIEN